MIVAPMTNRRIATIVALGFVLLAAADVVGVARDTTRTASAQAAAPTEAELKQAKEAYLAGKKLFDAKKFAEAVEKFKDSYRLSHNPALLFNIALTFSELGSRDMALFYYKKYLTDAPADAAQRPDAEAAIAEIEAENKPDEPPDEVKPPPDEVKPRPDEGDEVKPPPDEVKPRRTDYTIEEFEHTIVDEAPPGTPLDLMASPDDAPWTVTVYYRGPHDEKFNPVPMTSHHNTLVARIPAKAMAGNAVQYYIEVKDAAGTMLTRIGKSTSPNVIYLDANAKAQYFPDFGDDSPVDTGAGKRSDDDNPPGFGERKPPPGSGDVVITPSGPGFTDVGSSKFKMAKWATTGTGLGMLTLSVTFALMSSSYGASLEAEAAVSNDENCSEGPPCRTYDDYRKGIEATGKRYELISRIALGVGVVGTGLAAWFWYKEIKARKHAERVGATKPPAPATGVSSLVTAPLVGEDLFGASAALRF